MPETFSTRQAAVIASATKIIFWQFKITDNLDNEHYWSTGTCPSVGTETINSGATEAPGAYTSGEWNRAHTFKIVNFSGVTLRRNKTESGIHAPNDVNFTIVNSSNAYTASNFVGGAVRIGLVIDDGNGRELCGSWRFVIKSASPYNQQIDVVCEDFLQQYLKGSYPNTQLINEIFPNTYDANKTGDSICVPEPYGTCYIPLRPVYATDGRYYLLGDTTNTYTITKVRSPRSLGTKVEWDSGSFAFTQSTKADAGANNWRMFQPIISDSDLNGVVDSNGIWLNGSGLLDMPTKFSRSDTASITSPADIIKYVIRNMGVSDYDIDLGSFDTAKATYTSWGLAWNFAFWYKQDRKKVLANLLAMCHSCLIVGEKIRLQVLSKTSQFTIDETNVLASSETGPPQFQYTDSLAEVNSDSGYVAWQQTGESQDEFLRALVPAKSATDVIDQEVLQVSAVQDSQQIQKLGTLYYQRKFLKSADISTSVKGLILAIRPDDVATVDNSDYFGGTYNVLVDEVSITPDAAVKLRCIKFSETLDDWEDLAPSAITVGTDAPSSPGSYSPVIAGPDAPGATNLPNALPGRLRVGQTTNYILLEPLASSTRISLYSADVERMRFGNLNGYLDYVTNLYGIAIGDASNYLKYDSTNGLRISGAISAGTIDIGGADASSFHVDANGNMWLGASTFDIATNPFAVSNAGVMRAVSGTIGGFTLASTTLTGTNLTLDAGNQKITVGSGTDIAILDAADATYRLAIGHSTYASAPFRVTKAGALVATSATITGAITATSGSIGSFTIGTYLYTGSKTTYNDTNAGVHLGSDGIGIGNNVFTVSSAGALVATSATITGAITASSGSVGSFTIGTYLYTGSKTAYNDANVGVHLGSDGIGIGNNVFTVSAAGALVATSATITGAITATSGTFTGTINATAGYFGDGSTRVAIEAGGLNIGNTGSIRGGQTAYNTGTGFFLGYSGGAYKYSIGNPAGNYLTWDGSALTYTKGTLVENIIQMYTNVATLKTSATAGDGSASSAGMVLTYEGLFGCGANQTATIAAANANVRILATGAAYFKGVITADTGYIGGTSGWVISANYIKDVAGVVGLSSVVTAGDDIRFWAGHATPASAPFYVTEAGALVATSATITGAITATSGSFSGAISASTIDIGGDDTTSFHVDIDGGIWSGASIANKATAPFRVSNTGALVATSATIAGSLTAGNTTIANDNINFTEDIVNPSMMIWGNNVNLGSAGSAGSNATIGVFCNGGYIYILNPYGIFTYTQSSGILTRISYFGLSSYGIAYGIWGNGTYIYVVTATKLLSLSTNSGVLSLVNSYTLTSGTHKNVWAKLGDNYVYIANDTVGIQSFSVTAGILALVDTKDLDTDVYRVFGDGTYIYTVNSANLLRAFSVSSGVLTSIDTDSSALGFPVDLFCQGGFIFALTDGDIYSFTFNGTIITYKNTNNLPQIAAGVTGDGTYIYVLNGTPTLGIQSYSVDAGGAFTSVDTETTLYSGSKTPIGFDGTYLIAAAYNSSISGVSVNTLSLSAGVMTKVDNDDISHIGLSIYPSVQYSSNFYVGYDILNTTISRMQVIELFSNSFVCDAATNHYFKINSTTKMIIGSSSILLSGNLGLGGQSTFGTSAAGVIGLALGTAPTTAPNNAVQLWTEDINTAAGYCGLHMMVETNALKLIVPGVYMKTTTGQAANPFEGMIEINTFDNTLKMYADAGWRSLATW